METIVGQEGKTTFGKPRDEAMEYRDTIKKLITAEVKAIIDEEMKKAAQELLDEQRKAIKQIVEENKLIIREVVEEEKRAIWARAEDLRRSIARLGLG